MPALIDWTAERFWSMTAATPSGCIEWRGSIDVRGYGKIHSRERYIKTHRMAWELTHGPIPPGMMVCHRCDNPPCCNPDHLFLGTVLDNSQDMAHKGRAYRGKHNARITEEQAQEIRRRFRPAKSGASNLRILAREYDVSVSTIRRVALGICWG